MSASTTPQTPPVSPAEMQVLVSRAGLSLNPGQMADLVLAWRQLAGLLALIRRDRPMADDQAFVFRLPPPDGDQAPERPTGRRAVKRPVMRKAAKPTTPKASKKAARPKATAKRKTVRRGR